MDMVMDRDSAGKLKNKAQKAMAVIEYSLLVAVVAAALLGIQVYIKRAVCSRWRDAADSFGYGRQYQVSAPFLWEK